jgi:hypothetical protein
MADENPMTFEDLMSLQTLDFGEGERGKEQFMSVRPAFCAGGGAGASFGGHVYAQGVWAAAQTVGSGMVVHVSLSRDLLFLFLTYLGGDGEERGLLMRLIECPWIFHLARDAGSAVCL